MPNRVKSIPDFLHIVAPGSALPDHGKDGFGQTIAHLGLSAAGAALPEAPRCCPAAAFVFRGALMIIFFSLHIPMRPLRTRNSRLLTSLATLVLTRVLSSMHQTSRTLFNAEFHSRSGLNMRVCSMASGSRVHAIAGGAAVQDSKLTLQNRHPLHLRPHTLRGKARG